MRNRIITGIFVTLFIFLLLFLGKINCNMQIFLSIFTSFCFYELINLLKINTIYKKKLNFLGTLTIILSLWFSNNALNINIFFLFILILFFVFFKNFDLFQFLFIYFFVSLLILFSLSISFLYEKNIFYFMYLIVLTFGNDIYAYFIGKKYGKTKFTPISPNKTIEGSFAGVFFSIFTLFLLEYFLTVFCIFIPIEINLLLNTIPVLCLSILIAIFSQIGDLFFSKVKRYFNLKDYSNILPGHGGLLDLCDGFILSTILLILFLNKFIYFYFVL